MVDEEFSKQWEVGTVAGWTKKDLIGGTKKEGEEDNTAKNTSNPLYCKACDKLFTKSTTFTNHLTGRKHKKAVQNEGQEKTMDPRAREIALLEFRVASFSDLMREVVDSTRDYVLKKQTRTYDEIAADLEEQEQDVRAPSPP